MIKPGNNCMNCCFKVSSSPFVVFGRNGGENASYLVGENGVSAQDLALNQTDPFGLNDNERDIGLKLSENITYKKWQKRKVLGKNR